MRQDSISSALATFALGVNFRALPRQVVHNAKLRLLDTVGVCLASSGMDYADAVLAYVQEQGGKPDACLFGRPGRFPAALSVLYNGALAHGNDYDDTHSQSIVHPGGVVVPTALAISEKLLLTGEQAIVAIVAGYEIAARIGMAASKGFHAQGFHPTGVCGALASAAFPDGKAYALKSTRGFPRPRHRPVNLTLTFSCGGRTFPVWQLNRVGTFPHCFVRPPFPPAAGATE